MRCTLPHVLRKLLDLARGPLPGFLPAASAAIADPAARVNPLPPYWIAREYKVNGNAVCRKFWRHCK